jgi:hypothetical protein
MFADDARRDHFAGDIGRIKWVEVLHSRVSIISAIRLARSELPLLPTRDAFTRKLTCVALSAVVGNLQGVEYV